MASYQLKGYSPENKSLITPGTVILDEKMLLSNVHWFISVRWIVIIIFIIGSTVGNLFSVQLINIGFKLPILPLLGMAIPLLLMNTAFFLFSRNLKVSEHKSISINLWIQIVIDLIFVTCLVYYIGATDTFIPFIYLIHITLSCLFFPKHQSIIIVCIAASLYLLTVSLQNTGIIMKQTVFISRDNIDMLNSSVSLLLAFTAVLIWFIIWYFVSTLSDIVSERDLAL
jgi:two-component system phosphate regulon sensor histidine kinase PhoR